MMNINSDTIVKEAFVKESINILHNAYLSKKLVLFIGAGVDRDSGLPLWTKAIDEFCSHMNISSKDADNLKIPQFYFNSRGKKEYVELSREIFCHGKELPINDLHKKLVDFNVNTIITTNYTDFLEREMNNRGHIYRAICQDKDLPYTKNEKLIIKMHGDFEHDNFVLKEDDYLEYSRNFRLIETYIKAVIAKNMVLFVGYSFNDPDIKQLFSWVKDVLGDDFQQAYMLEGFKSYDRNVFEYYKNLGVNVIYTDSFDEDKSKALLSVLDLIKDGYGENLSDVEEAVSYFMPYHNINYILGKYLKKGLRICNLVVEADVLKSEFNGRNTESESNKLLLKLTDRISKNASDSNDEYDKIIEILQKSGVDRIEIFKDKEPQCIGVSHAKNELIDVIMTFDYVQLRETANRNEFLKIDDEQVCFQQAYTYYVLEDYAKAYAVLCDVAEKLFKKHLYYMYYIAQFDKVKIKSYIDHNYNIPDDIRNKIKEDAESINLNNIIMDMPDLSSNDNQMLKDIDSFQLQYSLFQDAYRTSEKMKKQQEAVYSFFAGVPDYVTLEWMIKDYYRYLICNCIMIDNYREVQEVFVLYVRSILANVAAPDKKDYMDTYQIGNIHAHDIGVFELFLIIKYMSEKDIRNMLAQCGMDSIPVQDNCSEYINIVLNNLKEEKGIRCNRELWNCLTILPYIDFGFELAETAFDCISYKFNYFTYREYRGAINKLLTVCHEKRNFKVKQEGTFQLSDYALGRFLKNLVRQAEAVNERDSHGYGEFIKNVFYVFHCMYDEKYDEDLSRLLKKETSTIIAKIYSYCSEQNKTTIKEYLAGLFKEKSLDMHELYFEMVMHNIIEPDEEYEKLFFAQIGTIKEQSRGCIPNTYQIMLNEMYNLYINDKVKHIDKLKEVIMNSDDPSLKFLGDMDNFDYGKFDIEWLNLFRGGLLTEIAQNETAKTNISKKFAEKIECGEVSTQLLKLYFKYFV